MSGQWIVSPLDADFYERDCMGWIREVATRRKPPAEAAREFEERWPELGREMRSRYETPSPGILVYWTHKAYVPSGSPRRRLGEGWRDELEELCRLGGAPGEIEVAFRRRRFPGGYWEEDGWEVMEVAIFRENVSFGNFNYLLREDAASAAERLSRLDPARLVGAASEKLGQASEEELAEDGLFFVTTPEVAERAGETLRALAEALGDARRRGLGVLYAREVA
jgi:hypothetical protein